MPLSEWSASAGVDMSQYEKGSTSKFIQLTNATEYGKVIEGMEKVDKIKRGNQDQNGSVENPDMIISFKSI